MPDNKGKTYNTEPKPKIKQVFDKVVNNSKSMTTAIREVYNTKRNPTEIKKSKSWQQLMNTVLPEKLIAAKHLALLNKEELDIIKNPLTGELIRVKTGEIDAQAVSKGIDMYYKISGKYPKEGNNTAIQVNIGEKVETIREECSNK